MLANLRLALAALERDLNALGDGSRLKLSAAEIGLLHKRTNSYRVQIANMEARLAKPE